LRYRTLTPTGDMTFGFGSANFLVNSPQTVQQATVTGLKLFLGEWFLNTSVGMPWNTQVIGNNTQALYDNAAKSQILSTTGVTGITSYASSLNTKTRLLTINAGITTTYGATTLETSISTVGGGYGITPYGQTYGG
jgi:hypothetical protein